MTVRVVKLDHECEVVPQAILWRSLQYCTLVVRSAEDDLDAYKGASFVIGNDIRFDLRVYRGHLNSEVTVTLYLPFEIQGDDEIADTVSRIISEMAIPVTAIAWKRGQKFEFGKLKRSPKDRLLEKEARILILKIAAQQPNRSASLHKLREEIPKVFDLSPADKKISPSRPTEAKWHIIVRNAMSSHTRLFEEGLAEKTPKGLKVTKLGLDYLNSIGFLDDALNRDL